MDREVECLCCHEVNKIGQKNQIVSKEENLTLGCITDNPGFKAVCLNRWVLEAALYQYQQQYDCDNNVPEHKRNRHIAYRQLVRWWWGVLGKEIRVVLPSCAFVHTFHLLVLRKTLSLLGFIMQMNSTPVR